MRSRFFYLITLSVCARAYLSGAVITKKLHNDIGSNHETTELPLTTTVTTCKLGELVQCLFEPLDEWAMVLYSLKENIVAISGLQCNTTRDVLRRCVEETAIKLECDQSTVLAVGARVTDLLLHKKDSGNLLRSYYVTAYVCTQDGQRLRNRIRPECLLQEHIGQMTFEAIKYIDDRLSHNRSASSQEKCSFLRQKAHLMRSIGNHKCASHEPVDAGLLMCETIKMTFLDMYSDTFGSGRCDFSCTGDQRDHPEDGAGGGGRRMTTEDQFDKPKSYQANLGVANESKIFLLVLALKIIF